MVFGAGAVGGYFGGRLAKAGVPVTFLVRENRYHLLKKRGLRVQSSHGNFSLEPNLARDVEELQSPTIVILAIKNYHLETALPQLKQLVVQGAKILPLLNGITHMKTLIDQFGADVVLGGSCYIEATLNTVGDIIHTSPMQDVVFGSIGDIDRCLLEELRSSFEQANVHVKLSSTIMVDMWLKYLFLSTFSAITAATRKPIGAIIGDPITCDFLENLVREAIAVAKSHEKAFPKDTFETIMKRFQAVPPNMTSSLHRDLEKGLPLELDSLQGAMIQMGAEYDIDTPNMKAVYALLHPYLNGQVLS
ncbi:ketopantoate reductase family protein [Alicyclobacillus fastidiosus]|uniref:2-dehydropantoate 2-reductase n=1 Tax=Alicyclobacillus fastidiosus TaxID=392011 RepID=A0ABV5AB84_9BACL|nr:ketopantoate reductase family protein [Alicyclobacillus fastidiosus]WEH11991.1 ketopantoate reductase family protein [Alicyclobacillus fastidiosus]